jgi:predicted transcriptional regulator
MPTPHPFRKRREALGVTQADFAFEMGVAPSAVSRFEAGLSDSEETERKYTATLARLTEAMRSRRQVERLLVDLLTHAVVTEQPEP